MNVHKLLKKQVEKYLPINLQDDPVLDKLLTVINDSYNAFERDKELAERAFKISEEEYVELNQQLKSEIGIKKISIERIKKAIGTITGIEKNTESDDLLMIVRYLNQQVNKRKEAELIFSSLITNMQSAILLEDENRHIVFTNQHFCDLFHIPVPPQSLVGADCSESAEQSKGLFKDPEHFTKRIQEILAVRKLVSDELIELADGRIFERDYIPIFLEKKYKGHFWSYRDITASKKAQVAIEKSEKTNRLIMNSALDAIIIINDKAEITFWNPQAEKIFGWAEKEIRGKRLTDTIVPSYLRLEHEKGMHHFHETGKGPALNKIRELVAVDKNNREFPIELSMIEVRQDDQLFFCGFVRDISERKKSEEELSRLSRVASSNESGVLFTDRSGKITWVNDGYSKITGYTKDEIIGRTPVELNKGTLSDKTIILSMVEAFNTGQSFDIEIIQYHKDGHWYWGRTKGQPILDTDGKVTQYFALLENVTQEKLKEEQLQILSSISAENKNAVVIADRNGNIEWVNNSFEKMTGFSFEEVKGRRPGHFLQGPDTNFETIAYLSNQIRHGEPFNCEILNYHKNGKSYWLRIQGQALKNANGEIIKYFAIEEDVTAEKESNRKIREAEQLWQFALEGAGDGVWDYNFETKKLFLSEQNKKILGYSKDDEKINLLSWLDLIHPDDRHVISDTDDLYQAQKIKSHRYEYRIKNKVGQYIWILDRGMITERTDSGKPIRIIGTHTNINFIKETESALRKSEEEFRSLAENIPGVLYRYEFNQDGTELFTYISPEPERKIGLTADELNHFYDNIHPEDLEREREATRLAFENKAPFEFEGRFQTKGNPIIWLKIYSYYSHTNAKGALVRSGIILNITKEKEAELAIQMREEKYRNIITNMNLGLMEVDKDEVIQFVNNGFCEMSGYSPEEMIGKKAATLFIAGPEMEVMTHKNELRKKGVSDAYEITVRNKKGELKWWLISGAPRYNDSGDLTGSIGIHLDITEQKKLELELIDAREQAESSATAKQTFLANMSHEIRTPMNAILGMTHQLGKTRLDKDQLFYLNTIHSAADNLLIIINDILDLSKIDAGKLSLEKIGFEPRMVINRVMQVMMHRAEEKGLDFTNKNCDIKLSPILIGDPYRLNQILLNLVSNAIKFTHKGTVDISCFVVKNYAHKQKLRVAITDTGIGMDETFSKNLFQKFIQEDSSILRKYGGTGLGMSISKELIELMGGIITVNSKKGEGTVITIDFEFEKGTVNDLPVKEIPITDTSILQGKKILVTDDNEMNQLVAATVLQNYGAEIKEAFNGEEAVKLLQQEVFDLVFMDIQMPVMDGFQATHIIRDSIDKNIPIIALTANAIKGDNIKCLEAGMNDYISKPFEEMDLVNMVAKWLNEKLVLPESEKFTEVGKLYDLTSLKEISRGNEAFVKKMLHLFIEQVPAALSEINNSFEQSDFLAIKKAAHRIKPSIDSLGINSLKSVVRQIETLALENKHSEELTRLLQQFNSNLKKVITALKKEL